MNENEEKPQNIEDKKLELLEKIAKEDDDDGMKRHRFIEQLLYNLWNYD